MVFPIIFVLLCLPHTLVSQNSIKPLRELAAEALLNKWSLLPNNELPSDDDLQKASCVQDMLMPKKVYQYYAFKALKDSEGCNVKSSTSLEILPSELPSQVLYSADIRHALIDVQSKDNPTEKSALLYSFDHTQKKYTMLYEFPAVQCTTMSKNGMVIALCKKNSRDPLLCEIKIHRQKKIDSVLRISKKLEQGQTIEKITLNEDGSVLILTVKNVDNTKTKNISLWSVKKNKTEWLTECNNLINYSFDASCTHFLAVKANALSLRKRTPSGGFEQLWEKPSIYFEDHPEERDGEKEIELSNVVGAAISPGGSLFAVATRKACHYVDRPVHRLYYYLQFHTISNGEVAVEYEKAQFNLYKNPVIFWALYNDP